MEDHSCRGQSGNRRESERSAVALGARSFTAAASYLCRLRSISVSVSYERLTDTLIDPVPTHFGRSLLVLERRSPVIFASSTILASFY